MSTAEVSELPDPLTIADICRLDRVNPSTVEKWLRRGVLRGYQIGRQWRVFREVYLAFRKHNSPEPPKPRKPVARVGKSRERDADKALDRAGV